MREQKSVVRALFEQGWNQQDFRFLKDRVADTVQFHYRSAVFSTTLEALQQLVGQWRTAFPDLHFTVGNIVAEGDLVAVSLRYTGTHLGAWAGVPPTGKAIEVEEMMFFRFAEGYLVEAWEVQDEWALWQQIGALAPPSES